MKNVLYLQKILKCRFKINNFKTKNDEIDFMCNEPSKIPTFDLRMIIMLKHFLNFLTYIYNILNGYLVFIS